MNENASAWYGSVSVGASQIVDEHPMIKLLTNVIAQGATLHD